jgi:hypothetical protein
MKGLKITVDLEEMFDEEYFNGRIEDIVADKLMSKLQKKITDTTVNQVLINMADKIDSWINDTLSNFIDRPIKLTDKYGSVIEEYDNVSELLKGRFDEFMSENVDEKGRSSKSCSTYGKTNTRLQWLLGQIIEEKGDIAYKKARSEMDDLVEIKFKEHKEMLLNDTAKKILKKLDIETIK